MPTLLEILARGGGTRGVAAMARPPAARQQAAPTRRTTPRKESRTEARQRGAVNWSAVEQEFRGASQRKAEQEAANPEPEGFWGSQFGRGLGVLVNNPVTRVAMSPLQALDAPRRTTMLGLSELKQALPDAFDSLPLGGLLPLMDEQRIADDERSNMEKLLDPEFGFGQMTKQSGNQWVDRSVGLLGDVALDPLTYVTGGATKIARGGREVVAASGRAGRASELAELARRLPAEKLEELAPDIQRAGLRGLNTASPALREALGLTDPHLRMMGARIPGSQVIAKPLAEAGGVVRQGVAKIPGLPALARGPKGLEAAMSTITREGNDMTVPRALTNVALSENIRMGEGEFTTRGNRMITDMYRKELRGLDEAAIKQMVRETEAGVETPVSKILSTLPQVYKEVSGKDIEPFLLEGYFPHMLSGTGRRTLREAIDRGDKTAIDFMERSGFARDDLLEASGNLGKARKLTPNPDGTPRVLDIGGKEVTITSGTLDELNEMGKRLFPGMKGDLYETHPVRVLESYVNSVARQAGRDKAVRDMAATPNSFVREIEGELADEVEARNAAYGAQQPLADEVLAGYKPGVTPTPVPTSPDRPGVSEFFAGKELTGKTSDRNKEIIKAGKDYVDQAATEVKAVRTAAAEEMKQFRDDMMDGLRLEAKADSPRIKELDTRIGQHQAQLATIGPLREETAANLQAFMVGIRSDIADLEREIKRARATWKGKLTKEQNRIEAKLRSSLATMREVSRRADERLNSGPRQIAEAVRRRVDDLTKPIQQVERQIDEVTARVPGKVAPDRLQFAREVVQRKGKQDFDELREQYRQAIEQMEGLQRTYSGRYTGESMDKIDMARRILDQKIAEQKAVVEGLEGQLRQGVQEVPNSAYDEALAAAEKLSGAAKTSAMRKFQKGGKFYDERRARAILAEDAAYEKAVKFATRDLQPKLRAAKQRVYDSPEWAEVQAVANGSEIKKLELDAQRKAERLARDEAAVARMEDPTITRTGPGKPVGFNQERDVEAPQRIGTERDAALAPKIDQLEATTNMRDEVLEEQRGRLRTMDDEITQLSHNLQTDLADRRSLAAKREESLKRLEAAKKTKFPKRGEAPRNVVKDIDELTKTAEDLAGIAAANPRLDDDALAAAESLLQTHRQDLERVKKVDLRRQDVQRMIDAAYDGELAPVMLTVVNDNWRQLHDGPLQRGDFILDAELANRYQLLYEITKQPSWMGRTFNAATNLFKTYATLSPGFHVRNALSAIFMNASDGVPLPTQFMGFTMWQKYMKGGEEWLAKQPDDVRQAFQIAAGSGAGGRFTEAGVAQSADNAIYNKLVDNRATRWSQRQGERVEGGVRLGMALDSLAKGETPQAALARITRIHFDYGQVSKFDEKAKRVVPFWTFTSRNLPMQLSQMWTKPRLYLQYQSFARNFSAENEEYTPEYWLDAGAWNTGKAVPSTGLPVAGAASGLPIYAAPDFGFSRLGRDTQDIEQFLSGENMGGLLSNLNPIISAPVEFAMKQDAFTGQKFEDTDYSDVNGLLGLPANALAAALGQRNEAGQVSDNFMNALRSVNPLQDRSARLAPQLSGNDEEAKKRQLESLARFLGVPVRTLTPKQQSNEYFRQYYDALDEAKRQKMMAAG